MRIWDAVVAPVVTKRVEPAWPKFSRAVDLKPLLLEAIVDKSGHVCGVKVVSSPSPELARAASIAVRQWEFSPATSHGSPVAVFYPLIIHINAR